VVGVDAERALAERLLHLVGGRVLIQVDGLEEVERAISGRAGQAAEELLEPLPRSGSGAVRVAHLEVERKRLVVSLDGLVWRASALQALQTALE